MADRAPIVLGQQFAAAKKAEEERIAQGAKGPTPLGALWRYDAWAGELSLVNPTRQRVDKRIEDLGRQYVASDATAREEMRSCLSMDDFYTLIVFSKRAAVFTMRSQQSKDLSDGLTALAMIDLRRVDPRDAIWAMGLLWSAAAKIGANAHELFREAAAIAEPGMAAQFTSFAEHGAKEFRAWSFMVLETAAGPGLVCSDGKGYEPHCNLGEIAFELAKVVEHDHYRAEVTLASEMPKVWLSGIDNDALSKAMDEVIAGASVRGYLRPEAFEQHRWQHFIIFVIETANEEAAETFERLAVAKRRQVKDIAMANARKGCVFCLVIGRSAMAGVKAFETPESILRFESRIQKILSSV